MKTRLLMTTASMLAMIQTAGAIEVLPLAGEWRFRLDREDVGEQARWFAEPLDGRIHLPGGLTEQGVGDPPDAQTHWVGEIQNPHWNTDAIFAPYATRDHFKFPYWLTPDRYYAGAAWFQRDIDIPADWKAKRVVLSLERAHWETRVWVDGKPFGSDTALGTPHDYDLGQLTPGKHVLTIRVDNRLIVDVGVNSHSVSDHTQGNWNGLVGRLELKATPLVWIDRLEIWPDAGGKSVRIRGLIGNRTGTPAAAKLAISITNPEAGPVGHGDVTLAVDEKTGSAAFETDVRCEGAIARWDEFTPSLYRIHATLECAGATDRREATFGFREIATDGSQLLINGHKAFVRGTLECAIFPKTGHPPTDVASWKTVIRAAKAHGLNLLRFHSWCPPEAAFQAADELGMYFQIECSSWANQSTTLGDGKPVDAWIYAEADRILKYYGNHPCFVLMLYGNEPGGKHRDAYLSRWIEHYRALDSRRLYSSGSGWPELPENQFHVVSDPRIQQWGEELKSRINGAPPATTADYRAFITTRKVPVISHEIGQWCVYPNFDEIPKYTGYLKPRNFEIFRDLLAVHHMADQAHAFLIASGKLQTLCYKEDIESALRTPGMGGFELLDLHDFPGQGTALVGVLDPFWESKGYVTPEEYRRFCNATVPLARLEKRVFTSDETLTAAIEIAHFGAAPLKAATPEWALVDGHGTTVARGELPSRTIPVGNGTKLGDVAVALAKLPAPARYTLVVRLRGMPVENDWDVWVYPAKVDTAVPANVAIASELGEKEAELLRGGGRVLLLIAPDRVKNADQDPVKLGFSSIFWNTAWTKRQAPTTLGVLCNPEHPALKGFPTEGYSNWQWWYVIHQAGAMILDDLPAGLRPTVQVIDDWFTARKLGLVFEAKVGAGRLLVCSVDLEHDLDPVRRQLKASLLRYAGSDAFAPKVDVTLDQVRALMK